MAEKRPDEAAPSTPDQAQRLVDMVSALEQPDIKYPDIIRPFQAMFGDLPPLLAGHYPDMYIAGVGNHPYSYKIFKTINEVDDFVARWPLRKDFAWAFSADETATENVWFELDAGTDQFMYDLQIFAELTYQQVAEISIGRYITFGSLPIQLQTSVEFKFWQDDAGAIFIDRSDAFSFISPSVEGQLMEDERRRQTYLAAEILAIEKGEDSPGKPREYTARELFPELDWTVPRLSIERIIEFGRQNEEATKAENLQEQNAMLEARSRGKGIVSTAEADTLAQLLETLSAAA